MLGLVLAPAVIATGLAAAEWFPWRRARDLKLRLARAIPYALRAGLPDEEEGVVIGVDWKIVDSGGDNSDGILGGKGNCPCQSEYTVKTNQIQFGANRPNKAQIAKALDYPLPAPPDWRPCPKPCVQVNTHAWHGWMLIADGEVFVLNCTTFAQYHCKLPKDPDVGKRPKIGSPPKPKPQPPPPKPPKAE